MITSTVLEVDKGKNHVKGHWYSNTKNWKMIPFLSDHRNIFFFSCWVIAQAWIKYYEIFYSIRTQASPKCATLKSIWEVTVDPLHSPSIPETEDTLERSCSGRWIPTFIMRTLRVKEGNWAVPGHLKKWAADYRRAQIGKAGLFWN